jgi:endonuclease YncB( thermonuclease family)
MWRYGDRFRTLKSGPRPRNSVAAVLLAIAAGSGPSLPASADVASADVIGQAHVVDGDTLRVRLHGIDAPESRQSCTLSGVGWPCGQNATRVLTGVVDGQVVTCRGDKRDRYGRLIAVCYIGSVDLNARMVRDGWALAYRRYASDYIAEESEARAAGSGIWQGQFVEPWKWRGQSRAEAGGAR